MNTDTKIMHIGSSAATFIRSQARKLDLSDDEKVAAVMIASSVVSAIFIDAFAKTNALSQSSVIRDYIQSVEEVLRILKKTTLN